MTDTAMTDTPAPRYPANRHAVTFVLITVFLDMVGFGLILPVLPKLIETVGKVDIAHAAVIDPASTSGGQITSDLDGRSRGDGKEHGVGGFGQVVHAGKTGMAPHLGARRVDRPDCTREPPPLCLANGRQAVAPADKGDVAGRQKPPQIVTLSRGHAPRGLRIDRLMICR